MIIAMIGQKGLPPHAGGIERHVSELARGLVRAGHRVIAYGRPWYAPKEGNVDGAEARITRGIHTKHLDAITHCFTAVVDAMRYQPDIVHIHGTGAAILVPVARLLHPRAKVIVTFHCIDRTLAKWNWFAKFAFRIGEWFACHLAHRTIVVSQQLAAYCLQTYGCQVTYVPHPFTLSATDADPQTLVPYGLKPEAFLLCVARLISDKHIHTLIHAYAEARRAHPERFAELPLVIVGDGSWTDKYVHFVKDLARHTEGVVLLGERCGADLRAMQSLAYAHVLPSASEGLAFVLLEAAAFRRPIVMTDLLQNVEATGGNGILVKPADIASLTRGLIEIAHTPKAIREQMGQRLHDHVALINKPDTRVAEVAAVYEEALGSAPTSIIAAAHSA